MQGALARGDGDRSLFGRVHVVEREEACQTFWAQRFDSYSLDALSLRPDVTSSTKILPSYVVEREQPWCRVSD